MSPLIIHNVITRRCVVAQLTIYMDDETLDKVERSARLAKVSVSRWVRDRLSSIVEKEWPEGYFDLFASLSDEDIERPAQPILDVDAPRDRL
jgi:hypothetical protein